MCPGRRVCWTGMGKEGDRTGPLCQENCGEVRNHTPQEPMGAELTEATAPVAGGRMQPRQMMPFSERSYVCFLLVSAELIFFYVGFFFFKFFKQLYTHYPEGQ